MRASRRTLGLQPELDPVESSSEGDTDENQSENHPDSQQEQEGEIVEPSLASDDVNVNDTDASMGSDKSSDGNSIAVIVPKR